MYCRLSESVSCSVVHNPWTEAYQTQTPLSMEFSRQEDWKCFPLPFPRDLPDPGIKPRSPAFQAQSLPSEPPKPQTAETELNMVFR